MAVSQSVIGELKRKGTADIMAFVGHRQKRSARAAPSVAIADLAEYFLSDERCIFAKCKHDRRPRRTKAKAPRDVHLRFFPQLGIAYGTVDMHCLRRLTSDLPVRHVSTPLAASLVRPIDRVQIGRPSMPMTWGISAMNVPALWALGFSGRGVSVGHVDTGVDDTHPTLRGAVRQFAFIDDLGQVDLAQTTPFDSDEHGTHTAGTIAGREVRGRSIGVAPGADLVSCAVIEGGIAQLRIIAGIEWVLSQGVRIINMSCGVRGFTEEFHLLTQRIRELDVLPVFAVGNEGVNTSRAPGNYDEALSVGAVDSQDHIPDFSSSDLIDTGRTVPDLVAPGAKVESALAGGGYLSMSGTSMAAPHIAGLAALLLEAKPNTRVGALETAIFASCRPIPGAWPERAGLGLPQADIALANL